MKNTSSTFTTLLATIAGAGVPLTLSIRYSSPTCWQVTSTHAGVPCSLFAKGEELLATYDEEEVQGFASTEDLALWLCGATL